MPVEGKSKFNCPSCGKQYTWKPQLAGKSARCTCGRVMIVPDRPPDEDAELDRLYDLADAPAQPLRPAPRPAPAPAPAPTTATPAAPILPHAGRRPPAVEEPESPLKKMAVLLMLLVLVGGAVWAGGVYFSRHTHKKPTSPMLADDAYVEEHLDDGLTDDVDAWLDATPRRMVMGMTNSQAKALAAEWRRMGAKRVIAFGAELSMSLAVELPTNPAGRKAFFDYEHEHHYDFRKPPARDVGQKWLIIAMHV